MFGISWLGKWCRARKRRADFLSAMNARDELVTSDVDLERARELIADAFQLPPDIQRRLYETDKLSWIYEGVAGAFSDRLENEFLHLNVEQELNRVISCEEAQYVISVADVARLLKSSQRDVLVTRNLARQFL